MYIIYVCDFGFETTDVGLLLDSVTLHLSHDQANWYSPCSNYGVSEDYNSYGIYSHKYRSPVCTE